MPALLVFGERVAEVSEDFVLRDRERRVVDGGVHVLPAVLLQLQHRVELDVPGVSPVPQAARGRDSAVM